MIYCTSLAIKGIFLTRKTYGGKLSQDSEVQGLVHNLNKFASQNHLVLVNLKTEKITRQCSTAEKLQDSKHNVRLTNVKL